MTVLKVLLLLTAISLASSYCVASMTLKSYSFTQVLRPALSVAETDQWHYLSSSELNRFVISNVDLSSNTESNGPLSIIGDVLAYPSPFTASEGVDLGFSISQDATLELYVYDMLGRLRIHQMVEAKEETYNKIRLTEEDFSGGDLSAGVYFYLLTNGDEVLGKGKVGVLP